MITDEDKRELCKAALKARERSYCPYSRFAVGAAVLTVDGKIYTGCNIENSAFSPSVCAERVAVSKAVSEGFTRFLAIAVAGGPAGSGLSGLSYCPPCGVCRQVLSEFCSPELTVLLAGGGDDYKEMTLGDLLPLQFGKDNLG